MDRELMWIVIKAAIVGTMAGLITQWIILWFIYG